MTPAEVRAAREALGMTQAQLAVAMGCGPRAVQTWESGERNISATARLALAFMLRVPRARWPSVRP